VAEKLDLPQITYAESIELLQDGELIARRALPLGTETVRCILPCLLTVVNSANEPRPPSVRRMLMYKLAAIPLEYPALVAKWPEFETEEALDRYLAERDRRIPVWSAADVGAEDDRVGLSGSPTKVLKVDFVVLDSGESKEVDVSQEGIAELVHELIEDYIL
jgi:electron transfer flavoprotein beta subunit